MKPIIFNRQKVIDLLVNPETYGKVIGVATYSVTALIGFGMTVMNIITHKGLLTVATGVFGVLCLVNLLLVYFGSRKAVGIASAIFAVEMIVLFTFFILSGNPEGFSAIWVCLAPPIGMLFYNTRRGSVFCFVVFLELVFFLWTPWGKALLPAGVYTVSFLSRFPLLYFSFFLLSFFLQFLRNLTWDQLDRTNRSLETQATHDQLTGLYNRQGLFDVIRTHLNERHTESFGAVIFDLDHFKTVNDTYGHDAGDLVLIRFAEILQNTLRADVGRWGGEEFAAFFYNDDVTPEDMNNVLERLEKEVFTFEDKEVHVTCSAGVCEMAYAGMEELRFLIYKADGALYLSKNSGRNRVSYVTATRQEMLQKKSGGGMTDNARTYNDL